MKNRLAKSAFCALALALSACALKDPIRRAAWNEKNAPDIQETRAIAEQGFIYGLPLVMNYAVMYDYGAEDRI